jgi:hypothetical protein
MLAITSVGKATGLGQAPSAFPKGCDMALEFPDHRVIMPDDLLTLVDMCQAVPVIFEAMWAARGGGHARPKVTAGMLLGQGPAVGGGGGFPSGGSGPKGTQGNPGAEGASGPAGPPGSGFNVDFVVMASNNTFEPQPNDGTVQPFGFIGGGGGTIRVPWSQSVAGKVVILVNAAPGERGVPGVSVSGQIGVRVDGTDRGLSSAGATLAPGGKTVIGLHSSLALDLSAGSHEAILVGRGLIIQAFTGETPIVLTVIHP